MILITGASGFIGGHVLRLAASTRDAAGTGYRNIRPAGSGVLHPLDLEDEEGIRRLVRKLAPEVVIHTAGWSRTADCENQPEKAVRINTRAVQILAEESDRRKARLVFLSTDMVFDGEKGDYRESDPVNPVNHYGRTKAMAEAFLLGKGGNVVIARVALCYGKPAAGGHSFSQTILRKLKTGEPMKLFTDQFRTPVLVNDLAAALLELAVSDFTGILHLGGSERVDRYTFGCRLAEIRGLPRDLLKPVSMSDYPAAAPAPRDVSMDITLAGKYLRTGLRGYREGLKEA